MCTTTNIYSVAYSLVWFPRILGLAPISMKEESKIYKFQSSTKILVYSVLVAGGIATLSLYIIYTMDYNFKRGPTIIFKIKEYAETLITAAFIIIICVNHRKLIFTITNTSYVDRKLLFIGVPITFKSHVRILRIRTLCAVILVLMPFFLFSYHFVIDTFGILHILSSFLSVFQTTTSFYMQSLYQHFMFLIRQRFQIINTQISMTSTDASEHRVLNSALFGPLIREPLPSSSNQIIRTSTFRIPTNNVITPAEKRNSADGNLSCIMNTCQQSCKVENTGTFHAISSSDSKYLAIQLPEESQKSRVRLLAHLHDCMCDTAEVLNSAFSVQNLLLSGKYLVDITVNSYCCFFVFKVPHMNTLLTHYMYYSLYMTLCSVIQFTGILAASTFTAEEVSFVSYFLYLVIHLSYNLPYKVLNIKDSYKYFSF